MKKFLTYALTMMMILATVAVSASAVSFVAGDGYDVYSGASYSEATAVGKSPVTMTENEDGSVTIEQGGYYCNYKGDNNYGGVATAEKVGLDGLEVVVNFDTVPVPTNDCWFGILLVQEGHPFNTANMGPTGGYNPLIRFNVDYVEFYTPTFGGLPKSEAPAGMFALQSGDVLKMSVEYKLGQYYVTYDHNGTVYEVPGDRTLDASNLLLDQEGKAYVVVTGTLLGDQCDWKYTVSVKEGEGISEEELANRAFELAKGTASAEIAGYGATVEGNIATAKELAGEGAAEEVVAYVADAEAAVTGINDAKAALEAAADQAAVDAAIQLAKDAVKASNDAIDNINFYIEINGSAAAADEVVDEPTTTPDTTTPDTTAPATTEEPAEEGGLNPVVIVVIVVVVVVVILAVVILGKKKKD